MCRDAVARRHTLPPSGRRSRTGTNRGSGSPGGSGGRSSGGRGGASPEPRSSGGGRGGGGMDVWAAPPCRRSCARSAAASRAITRACSASAASCGQRILSRCTVRSRGSRLSLPPKNCGRDWEQQAEAPVARMRKQGLQLSPCWDHVGKAKRQLAVHPPHLGILQLLDGSRRLASVREGQVGEIALAAAMRDAAGHHCSRRRTSVPEKLHSGASSRGPNHPSRQQQAPATSSPAQPMLSQRRSSSPSWRASGPGGTCATSTSVLTSCHAPRTLTGASRAKRPGCRGGCCCSSGGGEPGCGCTRSGTGSWPPLRPCAWRAARACRAAAAAAGSFLSMVATSASLGRRNKRRWPSCGKGKHWQLST